MSFTLSASHWWGEVYKKVKKAIVFLDNGSAECLHWQGGLLNLLNAGAVSVKEFSSFENGTKDEPKGVFIITSPVIGINKDILKDIIINSKFKYCILITSCGPAAYTAAQEEMSGEGQDMGLFHKLEQDLLSWMGNKDYTVEILNFPLFLAPITSNLFVTPPIKDIFPMVKESIKEDLQTKHTYPEYDDLPKNVRISIDQLASGLSSLLPQLDMQEEIYCLGSFSNLVATQLEAINLSVTRRRNATKKTCLILIDRTLDFGSVMSFSSDSLLDRIQTVLPRLPEHSSDICVNMSPLCAGTVGSIAPGCMAHKGPVLEWLVNLKQKDVLLNLCQEFQNLNDIQIKYPLRNIPQLLDRQIITTYSKETKKLIEHSGFIEQVLAVTETLNSAKNSTVELAMSIEKLLLQTIAADNGTSGAINQLCQLFRCRHERKLSVEVLLCILVNLYSMVGTQFVFQRHEEETLKKEIVDALYNDRHLLNKSVFRVNHKITQEKANDLGHHIISKLQALLVARNNFSKYRNVLKYEGPHQPLVYNGLLDQLLTDLTDPHKPPIPELVHKSQGLFRSGFSKLLSSSHPSDNQTFFLFMIGGVSGQETRKIIEYFKKVKKEVIVGSTRLVSPSDVLGNYLNLEKFC